MGMCSYRVLRVTLDMAPIDVVMPMQQQKHWFTEPLRLAASVLGTLSISTPRVLLLSAEYYMSIITDSHVVLPKVNNVERMEA